LSVACKLSYYKLNPLSTQ